MLQYQLILQELCGHSLISGNRAFSIVRLKSSDEQPLSFWPLVRRLMSFLLAAGAMRWFAISNVAVLLFLAANIEPARARNCHLSASRLPEGAGIGDCA